MTLDIAQSSPVSVNPAGGGPTGAGPPTPANDAHAFAAMLAQQKPPNAGQTAGAGPKTADTMRDDKTRSDQNDKKGDKDAPDDPALSGLSPVSVQTLPTEAIPLAVSLVPPGLPVPIAPSPIATAANSFNTSEAMDTSLSGAPAPPGGTTLPTGGELLPQTLHTPASPEGHAPALFSLPGDTPTPAAASPAGSASPAAASPALAGVASAPIAPVGLPGSPAPTLSETSASAKALPASISGAATAAPTGAPQSANGAPASGADPASSPATKIALQGYAQFGQTDLQNAARPANNTGKGSGAPAVQAAEAAGNNASLFSSLPQAMLSPTPAEAGVRAEQDWARAVETEAGDAEDKPGTAGDGVSGTVLMPTTAGTGETKTATAPASPMLPQERMALMQQASDGMQALHTQVVGHGQGQMTLQLHPQDWGKLQVSVTMTPDATGSGGTRVIAHLVADSAAVKQALETGGSDLRRTLREAGLHLETMTVTVRPPAASSDAQSMGGSFSGNAGQNASQDAQSWPAPGSRGDNAPGAAAGGGGTLFGGGGANTGTQNPQQRQTALRASAPADDYNEHDPPAVPISRAAGRLDTRA